MKMWKRVLLTIALSTWSLGGQAGPGDMVATQSRVIKEVRIQNAPAGASYMFVAEGGWGAGSDCTGLLYPYISETAYGAKAILAAALTSKSTGTPLTFTGICGDTGGDTQYLQIRFTTY
jgi:hypothetical protein